MNFKNQNVYQIFSNPNRFEITHTAWNTDKNCHFSARYKQTLFVATIIFVAAYLMTPNGKNGTRVLVLKKKIKD